MERGWVIIKWASDEWRSTTSIYLIYSDKVAIVKDNETLLRGVKAWVSECLLIMIFMMGGASISIVTTGRHIILLSYELLKNRKIQIRPVYITPLQHHY